MSDVSLAMNKIAEELKKTNPSKKKVLNFLYDLQLYDFEFLNSIGETFKLNPLFFMKELYTKIWKKMGKLLGEGGRIRAERYIVENYSLYGGEQILYKCEGTIKKKRPLKKPNTKISVSMGVLFITNQRIIAQGKLAVEELVQTRTITPMIGGTSESEKDKEYRTADDYLSEASELCFGYVFPIKQLTNLRKSGRKLSYNLVDGLTTLTVKKEQLDKLYDILNQFQ